MACSACGHAHHTAIGSNWTFIARDIMSRQTIPESVDVIVVGFGFAGGSAALAAAQNGSSVLLLEKAVSAGGISICAAGGVRIASDPSAALAYLDATCGGKTPVSVLK